MVPVFSEPLYCMASLILIYGGLNTWTPVGLMGGLLVFDKCSWLISIKKEEMQGHYSECILYSYGDVYISEIKIFFIEWIFEKHGLQQWQTLCSLGLGHTLIPIVGINSRAIPRVHSTVYTGHSRGVHVGKFAWLLSWRGVLLRLSQVAQVAGNGEFLGTWCWLGFKDRKII